MRSRDRHFLNIPPEATSYDRDRDCPRQPGVAAGARGDTWRDCAVDRILYNKARLAGAVTPPPLATKPRPMNIERAFENLNFSRGGESVKAELISQPVLLEAGTDWRVLHLPTHADHFYDIQRVEFHTSFEAHTRNACHVIALVEGTSVLLETSGGLRQRCNFAETFVVPAAAGAYRLVNEGAGEAKVIRAFVRPVTP